MKTILQLILLLTVIILSEVTLIAVYEHKCAKLVRKREEKDADRACESVTQFWQNIISYDHKMKGGDKK